MYLGFEIYDRPTDPGSDILKASKVIEGLKVKAAEMTWGLIF